MCEKFVKVMSDILDKRDSIGEQDVLQEYDKDWENKKELHLDVKYNTFFIYLDYYVNTGDYTLDDIAVVHFILKLKPWNLTKDTIQDYIDFLNSRLEYNYNLTKKKVFKACLESGSENRKKVINEYLNVLEEVKV